MFIFIFKTLYNVSRISIRINLFDFQGGFMKNAFSLTKIDKYYYYYTYDGPDRLRYSTGCKSKQKAQAHCAVLEREGKLIPYKQTKPITFKEFSEPFWIWGKCPIVTDKIDRGYRFSQTLCKNNRGAMNKNIVPYFGSTLITEITHAQINKWLLSLRKPRAIDGKDQRILAPGTANKMFRILKEMLQEAVRMGMLDHNPATNVKLLHDAQNRRDAFTFEEAKKLLSNKEDWKNDIAWLGNYVSAFTGMRLSEIRALTRDDLAPGKIVVTHSYDVTIGIKLTKSDKIREIPIPDDIYQHLYRLSPMKGFIFSLTGGLVPVNPDYLREKLYAQIYKIGINEVERKRRNLTFHSWRHFFNTRLVASGVQGEITRAIVGHENEKMTARYLHLSVNDLEIVSEVQRQIAKVINT